MSAIETTLAHFPVIFTKFDGDQTITESLGFRFLLSSMFLIHPLPVPYIVSPTTRDALRFCGDEAKKRGLVVPEGLGSPWPDAP